MLVRIKTEVIEMLKRQVKTKSHRASVRKVALAFGLLFDDQAAGRAKSVYLAVVTDDAAARIRLGNPVIVRGRDAPAEADEACAFARGISNTTK